MYLMVNVNYLYIGIDLSWLSPKHKNGKLEDENFPSSEHNQV